MGKALIVEIKVINNAGPRESGGAVMESEIHYYDSRDALGYEIERMFEQLGADYAKRLDPHHE